MDYLVVILAVSLPKAARGRDGFKPHHLSLCMKRRIQWNHGIMDMVYSGQLYERDGCLLERIDVKIKIN